MLSFQSQLFLKYCSSHNTRDSGSHWNDSKALENNRKSSIHLLVNQWLQRWLFTNSLLSEHLVRLILRNIITRLSRHHLQDICAEQSIVTIFGPWETPVSSNKYPWATDLYLTAHPTCLHSWPLFFFDLL